MAAQDRTVGHRGQCIGCRGRSLLLESDEARFIMVTCLAVDGGVTEIAPLTAYGLMQG